MPKKMPKTDGAMAKRIRELEYRNEILKGELTDYAKTVARLRDELERAKIRIKELMES